MSLQTFTGFARVQRRAVRGSVVALAMLRELSPVLVGLMVTGRVGSSMAAEIGTMRVTEQLDALKALATDPIQYLFVPRVMAGDDHAPASSCVLGDALGIYGGYIVAVKLMGANPVVYKQNTFSSSSSTTSGAGLIKAGVFGLILTLTGCVQRLLHDRRRGGRRPRHDLRGRVGVADHPPDRLLPDEAASSDARSSNLEQPLRNRSAAEGRAATCPSTWSAASRW